VRLSQADQDETQWETRKNTTVYNIVYSGVMEKPETAFMFEKIGRGERI
jgi:hypothetical protein